MQATSGNRRPGLAESHIYRWRTAHAEPETDGLQRMGLHCQAYINVDDSGRQEVTARLRLSMADVLQSSLAAVSISSQAVGVPCYNPEKMPPRVGPDRKKLMILGAGPFQARGIRKAVALGYHVITVDYLPKNIGHQYSTQSVNCSTTDMDGVLAAAQVLCIQGVATFASDVATPTVAFVASKLGLPGPDASATSIMTNKARFREFQQRHGLPAPSFAVGGSFDAVWDAIRTSEVPLVFKPVDSSGSRGVSLVQSPIQDRCQAAFAQAQKYSRTGTVCVEDYLQGTEVGGDAFVLEGRVAFAVTTCKHRNGFVVTGHSLPGSLGNEDQERVVEAIEAHCALLSYVGGPLNFDAMVCGRLVTVIEMSPRTGGNGIPWLINRYAGVDLEAATVCWAMGANVAFSSEAASSRRGCGSLVVGSPRAGRLTHIATPEELMANVPNVADVVLMARQGDAVQPFEHGGNMIGCVLFDCDAPALYDRLVNRIAQVLDIRVAGAGEER